MLHTLLQMAGAHHFTMGREKEKREKERKRLCISNELFSQLQEMESLKKALTFCFVFR